jgi:hypothetical protein
MPTAEDPIYIVLVEDTYYPSGGTHDWEFATGDLEKAKHYAQAKVSKYGYATVARVSRLSGGSIYFDTLVTYDVNDEFDND